MIQNEEKVIADSLWSATLREKADCPPLVGETDADVAIVGGGFTGLSAALHLAEAGKRVIVLEAEVPGWGASGRNGGQINPGLKEDPDVVEAKFGPVFGPRMVKLSGDAAGLVLELIKKHNIDCSPVHTGWVQAAHSERVQHQMASRVEQWQRRGADVRLLSKSDLQDMIGTDSYAGGLLDMRGGNIQPLSYATGLARAAMEQGARVCGSSRVRRMDRTPDGAVLHTDQGSVRAAKVLLCTNGYTDGLVKPLNREVVPVRSVQVATRPLSDNVRNAILPGHQAVSDSRRLLLYYRFDPEGRFIMGGRGAYGEEGTRKHMQTLRKMTEELFPQIGDVEWEHAWGGYVAFTRDHFPHLVDLGDHVVAGLGYNGRGVAMATAMGTVLAKWAQDVPADELEFPLMPPKSIPFHGFQKLGVMAGTLHAGIMDRLGF